ncbi:hypothetical protein M407DRAFT_102149 [Tulasnella calospora MUT 4182]|uniref:Uncharacterized protein n=1 Tax=Tulasnella calospora MUT 4182 TaxID=1051891 RepID=A0A0C3QG26_9AGAM|nr:hypothetical protein M407DRAFT_102149 [Tulasnella calospora MUT 4182]
MLKFLSLASYGNTVNQGTFSRPTPPWSQTDQGYPPPQMVTQQPLPSPPPMDQRFLYESKGGGMSCNCCCLRPNDFCGCLAVCFGILCCCCGLGSM